VVLESERRGIRLTPKKEKGVSEGRYATKETSLEKSWIAGVLKESQDFWTSGDPES